MASDLVPGVVVAERFRLERPLGQGGMGAVWLARHLGLDIPCALKFIHSHAASSPEVRARFELEAKAAAQLRSPNVVQIFDHGVWRDMPYIAMELLEGEDLGQRLKKRGMLDPAEVVSIMFHVARALTRAHAAGLVHRDLKPANIFMVRDVDREIAKVLDFGVVKSSSESGLGEGQTATGALLGTPFYMSPEQVQGTRQLDQRSDLWSLGVIVFQCITGQLPFRSEALGDLMMKIMAMPIPVPSQIAPVPRSFDAWWLRASARDPAQRFQSARELAEALASAFGMPSQWGDAPAEGQARSAPAPAYAPGAPAAPGAPGAPGAMASSQALGVSGAPGYSTAAPSGQWGAANAPVPPTAGGAAPGMVAGGTYVIPSGSAPPSAPPHGYGSNPGAGYSAPYSHPGAPPKHAAMPVMASTAHPTAMQAQPPQRPASNLPLIIAGVVGLLGIGGVAALFMTGIIGSESEAKVSSSDSASADQGGQSPAAQSAVAASASSPSAGSKAGSTGAPPRKAGPLPAASPKAPASAPPEPPASPLKVGERCSANAWCQSGFCVDGYCCDSACNAKCMACSAAKKGASGSGYCGFVSGGEDPDSECGAGKRCDGLGSCVTLTPEQIKALTGQ